MNRTKKLLAATALALSLIAGTAQAGLAWSGGTSGETTSPQPSTAQPPVWSPPPYHEASGPSDPRIQPVQLTYFTKTRQKGGGGYCAGREADAIGYTTTWFRDVKAGTLEGGSDGGSGHAVAPDMSGLWEPTGNSDSSGNPMYFYDSAIGRDCIYRPQFTVQMGPRCVKTATVTLEQTAATGRTLKTVSESTPYGKGDHSLAACQASQSAQMNLDVDIRDYGQYKMSGSTSVDQMWVKVFPKDEFDDQPAPEAYKIQPAADQGVFSKVATLNCTGFHDGQLIEYGNDTACSDQHKKTGWNYQCKIGVPEVSDAEGKMWNDWHQTYFETLRNGKETRFRWDGKSKPSISGTGVSNARIVSTTFNFQGLPWVQGADASDNVTALSVVPHGENLIRRATVDSKYGSASGSFTATGSATTLSAWVMKASESSDDPIVVAPTWNYEADFTTKSVRVKGVTMGSSGGSWDLEQISVTKRGTASCVGEASPFYAIKVVGDAVN